MTAQRYRAGAATYPGDVRSIVGQVCGPTTFRSLTVATDAEYDAERDLTRVTFGYPAEGDNVRQDADGAMRLVEATP